MANGGLTAAAEVRGPASGPGHVAGPSDSNSFHNQRPLCMSILLVNFCDPAASNGGQDARAGAQLDQFGLEGQLGQNP